MSLTDKEIVKDVILAQTRSMGTAADDAANDIFSRAISVPFADPTANADANERVVYRARRRCRVKSVHVTPAAAITGSDADYKTCTLQKRTSAGASNTTVAAGATTATGGIGSIAAFAPAALTITESASALEAGAVLTFKAIHTAGGAAFGSSTAAGSLDVVVEEF